MFSYSRETHEMPGGDRNIKPEDGKPFKKNDPRINRKGRPKILPELEVIIAEVLSETGKDQKTAAEQVIRTLKDRAIKDGDVRAIQLLLERAYGKIPEKLDLTSLGKELQGPTFNFMPLDEWH